MAQRAAAMSPQQRTELQVAAASFEVKAREARQAAQHLDALVATTLKAKGDEVPLWWLTGDALKAANLSEALARTVTLTIRNATGAPK